MIEKEGFTELCYLRFIFLNPSPVLRIFVRLGFQLICPQRLVGLSENSISNWGFTKVFSALEELFM